MLAQKEREEKRRDGEGRNDFRPNDFSCRAKLDLCAEVDPGFEHTTLDAENGQIPFRDLTRVDRESGNQSSVMSKKGEIC